MKSPVSNPMSFWVEQDVLEYVYCYKLQISGIYGEVRQDYGKHGGNREQKNPMDMGIFDVGKPVYSTTRGKRTGCIYCGFGCHREKSPNRWEIAEKFSDPAIIDYMLRGGDFDKRGIWKPESRGLGFWFVIEWINLHGGLHITMTHQEKYLSQYMTGNTKKYLII